MKREWALVQWSEREKKWEKVYAASKDKNRLFYHRLYTDMTTTHTREVALTYLAECSVSKWKGHYALFNIFTGEMIDGSVVQS